ncbi:MAG: GntR family transcriptional regulator [Pseudomonadota bacterium]
MKTSAENNNIKVDRSQKTLRELTLEKVRSAIFSQYFKPGQRLVERTLCEELGVSRSVVREVLRHLETEGLVQSGATQGPIVATIDADTTRQIYELRALLEGHAAAACALRRDDAAINSMAFTLKRIEAAFEAGELQAVMEETGTFYSTMFQAAGDTVAWGVVNSLNARINRLRVITIASRQRGSAAPGEMHRLLAAIREQNPEAAQTAAQTHVRNAQTIAMASLARDES